MATSLTNDEIAELSYIDSLNPDGSNAASSWFLWIDSTALPHKWQSSGGEAALGVSGGTVTYSFNGTDFSAAQQTSIRNALTLWSDIADIHFSEVTSGANLVFSGSATIGDKTDWWYTWYSDTGKARITDATVKLNTSPSGGYGDLTSFTTYGGRGISGIVHELGHALGLGHGGPYNGTVDPSKQLTEYDNELYSIMSYYDPSNTQVKYYSSYTEEAKAANWGQTADGHARDPYTPQVLDILAVQQLYGNSTSSAYSGGQIFGFNCNITDASRIFYDFSANADPTPVVTLFDYGTGNTLDLSGYSMACSVNLNQGAYSSVGGLVNNVGIAYGARIDTAIGGGGDDVFYVNADSDTIDGGGGTNRVVFSEIRAHYTIAYDAGRGRFNLTNLSTGSIYRLTNIRTAQFTDESVTLCFLAGTRILTPSGEASIESLRPGDLVVTADGGVEPMVWLGRLTVAARFADPLRSFPVRVKAGALGENRPNRDLLVSPDHALLVGNVLIQAGALVNETSIIRETAVPETFVYYHVELDGHSLILAEGVAAETFVDNADRMSFDNWAEHQALFPEGRALSEMPYPRAKARRQVPPQIRAALDRRAEALGLTHYVAA